MLLLFLLPHDVLSLLVHNSLSKWPFVVLKSFKRDCTVFVTDSTKMAASIGQGQFGRNFVVPWKQNNLINAIKKRLEYATFPHSMGC